MASVRVQYNARQAASPRRRVDSATGDFQDHIEMPITLLQFDIINPFRVFSEDRPRS